MKGPGEFALAIMSPKISLATKGDIQIGNRNIEVKAAMNKSGGRMGETTDAASIDQIRNAILSMGMKQAKTPEEQQGIKDFSEMNSCALRKAVQTLHTIFDGRKPAVKAVIKEVVKQTFGAQMGEAVGKAGANDPSGVMAEQEFMAQNFDWYRKKGPGWSEILAIWMGGRKTFSFSSGKELVQLRASGFFSGASVSFIPTKSNEVFAQINFGAGGDAAALGGGAPVSTAAAKKATASRAAQKAKAKPAIAKKKNMKASNPTGAGGRAAKGATGRAKR